MKANSLNSSLSLMEMIVFANLKLYENFEDKIIYLENFYKRYFNEVFGDRTYVINLYETKFNNKIILESEFDFTSHVKKIHNFIRKAIKFEHLVEQSQNNNWTTQSIGSNQTVNSTVTKEKQTETWSWGEWFNVLREGLNSWTGAAIQTVLGAVPGVGPMVISSAWGALLLYDVVQYFSAGSKYVLNVLEDIFNIAASQIPSLGPEISKGMSLLKRLGISSINQLFEKLARDPVLEPIFGPFVSALLSIYDKVIKYIKDGANMLKTKYNLDWPLQSVNKVISVLEEFKNGALSYGYKPEIKDKKLSSMEKRQLEPNYLGQKI